MSKGTIIGTSWFPTLSNAISYYEEAEGINAKNTVHEKIAAGEISIGRPTPEDLLPSHRTPKTAIKRLWITDNRWHFETE